MRLFYNLNVILFVSFHLKFLHNNASRDKNFLTYVKLGILFFVAIVLPHDDS